MPSDVIAFDTTLDHPCPEVWRILQSPDWYPRFFRGLGSCEQVSDAAQQFEVRLSTPRGHVVVQELRLAVRPSNTEIRLEATPASRSLVSIRLTPDSDGTRIALRIFAVGQLHPDLAKVNDGAIQNWIREGLGRISEYLDGKQSSVLVNMGDMHSLQLSVAKTMIVSAAAAGTAPTADSARQAMASAAATRRLNAPSAAVS